MSRLSIATSPPQCLRMAAICGSCSSAKKMCSMDRNSWRRRRASFTASENACSRARLIRMGNSQRDMRAVFYLIPLGLFHAAPQRKLVFARQRVYLPDLGLGHLVWIAAVDESFSRAFRHLAVNYGVCAADRRLRGGEIDVDLLLRPLLDGVGDRLAIGGRQLHARDAERGRVAEEDLREAFGQDRADAEV